MLMAVTGTPEAEKEYTFTTPLEHGLSYKKLNNAHPQIYAKLAKCLDFVSQSVTRGNNDGYFTAEYLLKKFMSGCSDLWVSVQDEEIVGCFLVGVADYPDQTGIISEATAGKFHFETMMPAVEDYYRKQGANFVEIPGRKGWERRFGPMGYELKNVTIVKRL